MFRKSIIRLLVFIGILLAVPVIAYVFRDSLVRALAPRVLAEQQITLTRFDGLHFDTRLLTVTDIELTLASGQQLLLRDLAVAYHFDSIWRAPQLETVALRSAQLLPAAGQGIELVEETSAENLLLSDLLRTLREFPLPQANISDLRIPQSTRPLALEFRRTDSGLDLHIANGELRLDAVFSQADAAATASLQAELGYNNATPGDFELTLQPLAETYTLNGKGHLTIDDLSTLLGALQQAPLPFKSANLQWDIAGSVADDIQGTIDSAVNAADDDTAPTFVVGMQQGSTLVLPAGTVSDIGELSLAFTDRAELTVTTGLQPRVTGVLPLQVRADWQQQPLSVNTRITLNECRASPMGPCSITFDGNAGLGSYSLAGIINADIIATGVVDDPVSRYHISTEGLTLGGLPDWTPPFDVDISLTLDQQNLAFQTPLWLRGAAADVSLDIDGDYDLDSGAAAVRVNLMPVEFTEGRPLSRLVNAWPYAFDLLGGSVAAELDLRWQPVDGETGVVTGTVSALLQDLAGSYEDMFFRGLNGEVAGTVDTSSAIPLDTPPLALTIATVDVGLPLDNIALNFRLERDTQRLVVDSLSAQVLGGTVGGNNLDYGFDRARNELTLRFDGLRLERMLELAEYDGVAAAGAVSGEVPMTITADGVSVTAGTLQADAPGGSIRYNAGAAGATGNPGLDLVNQALGNYQFDSLVSDIDYTPEGELVLAMRMQGHNPDMNNGQRINLNLNLSDNIPALLQSLQAARAIEDFLQQQYQDSPP